MLDQSAASPQPCILLALVGGGVGGIGRNDGPDFFVNGVVSFITKLPAYCLSMHGRHRNGDKRRGKLHGSLCPNVSLFLAFFLEQHGKKNLERSEK